MYKSYHTSVKTCYALGIQDQILPEKFTKRIPATTSHYWKHQSPDKYLGGEFTDNIESKLNQVQTVFDKRVQTMTNSYYAFCRLYITILSFIGKDHLKKLIKNNREVFVSTLENLGHDFPVSKNTLLRFLQVPDKRYKAWLSDRKFACTQSVIGQCFKRRPNQIAPFEISMLKSYMNDHRYKIWCTRSVWGKAVRNGDVSMAESTWYKYARKLGFTKAHKPIKKHRKKGSFDASRPNETWHMDISQYKTFDNVIFYIYTVVDNFSRKIISWDIATTKSAIIRTNTVKQSIVNEFGVDLRDRHLDLIVDGGSENNNKTIHQFLKGCQLNIHKKIALKDVTFSNSIVEGPYKIMKSYYFRSKQILSTTIRQELEFFIDNYNNEKPCNKHKIYTPNEIHLNPKLAEATLVLNKSNKERLEFNRNYCCKETD